jgi:carbonic anhydrase/acetyltransferase-like protein (isoleucine patch superfamily)
VAVPAGAAVIHTPKVDPTAFIAPSAVVLGDVTLGPRASVWYQAVLRGDMAPIIIGEATNIQDATIVHVDEGKPAIIGARVGVGHRVILHACTVEDECLIGMGSILLNDVRIGTGSVVAAGAVVVHLLQLLEQHHVHASHVPAQQKVPRRIVEVLVRQVGTPGPVTGAVEHLGVAPVIDVVNGDDRLAQRPRHQVHKAHARRDPS